jgi:hypothetical protein
MAGAEVSESEDMVTALLRIYLNRAETGGG